MKKLFLLVALAALVAGCATLSKGELRPAAKVVEHNGAKWVRVLDTGLEFPLLGEWENAKAVTERESGGNVSTRFMLDESKNSTSLVAISSAKSFWSEEIFQHIRSIASGDESADIVCERHGGISIDFFRSFSGYFFIWCKEQDSSHWAGLLDPASNQIVHSVAFFGYGSSGDKNAPVFEKMMIQAVMHPNQSAKVIKIDGEILDDVLDTGVDFGLQMLLEQMLQ